MKPASKPTARTPRSPPAPGPTRARPAPPRTPSTTASPPNPPPSPAKGRSATTPSSPPGPATSNPPTPSRPPSSNRPPSPPSDSNAAPCAENARYAYNGRHAVLDFEREQQIRAHLLGTKLLFDPLNRCTLPKTDPESLRKLNEWRAVEPFVVVKELESFQAGADWMLARWAELEQVLDIEGYWHYPDKFNAIRLLGKRADDGFTDLAVMRLMLVCNALHPEAWTVYDDFKQASLGREGKPVYMQRTDFYKGTVPEKEDALKYLRDLIASERARLLKLKAEWLEPLHVLDRGESITRAAVETSPQSVLARRYETACGRDLHRALDALLKKRREEAKARPEEPDPCAATPEPETACAVEADAPNEPNGGAVVPPSRAVRRAQKRQKRQPKGASGGSEGVPGPGSAPRIRLAGAKNRRDGGQGRFPVRAELAEAESWVSTQPTRLADMKGEIEVLRLGRLTLKDFDTSAFSVFPPDKPKPK